MKQDFEQFVRHELRDVRKDIRKLEKGQHKLDKKIEVSQAELRKDVQKLEAGQAELKQDVKKLETGQTELKQLIGESQVRMTRWVVGIFIAAVVIMVSLAAWAL